MNHNHLPEEFIDAIARDMTAAEPSIDLGARIRAGLQPRTTPSRLRFLIPAGAVAATILAIVLTGPAARTVPTVPTVASVPTGPASPAGSAGSTDSTVRVRATTVVTAIAGPTTQAFLLPPVVLAPIQPEPLSIAPISVEPIVTDPIALPPLEMRASGRQ